MLFILYYIYMEKLDNLKNEINTKIEAKPIKFGTCILHSLDILKSDVKIVRFIYLNYIESRFIRK